MLLHFDFSIFISWFPHLVSSYLLSLRQFLTHKQCFVRITHLGQLSWHRVSAEPDSRKRRKITVIRAAVFVRVTIIVFAPLGQCWLNLVITLLLTMNTPGCCSHDAKLSSIQISCLLVTKGYIRAIPQGLCTCRKEDPRRRIILAPNFFCIQFTCKGLYLSRRELFCQDINLAILGPLPMKM